MGRISRYAVALLAFIAAPALAAEQPILLIDQHGLVVNKAIADPEVAPPDPGITFVVPPMNGVQVPGLVPTPILDGNGNPTYQPNGFPLVTWGPGMVTAYPDIGWTYANGAWSPPP